MAEISNHRQRRYPPELRERAVRLVAETAAERGDRHGAVTHVARQLGIGPESVRNWVHQAAVDAGDRVGLTTELALDALEMAIWSRRSADLAGLVHHSDRGVQYLAIRVHRAPRLRGRGQLGREQGRQL